MLGEGGTALSPGLTRLHQALAEYEPSSDLRSETIGLAHFRDLVDLALARAAGELAASSVWTEEGFLSPILWLREEAKLASGVAADRISVGSNLELVPQSLVALTEGEIGFAHLALMVRTAEAYRQGTFDEQALLGKANASGRAATARRAGASRTTPRSGARVVRQRSNPQSCSAVATTVSTMRAAGCWSRRMAPGRPFRHRLRLGSQTCREREQLRNLLRRGLDPSQRELGHRPGNGQDNA